jgi:UDP-N-acetylglucosamine 2-epimerase (non-hydrolysing)
MRYVEFMNLVFNCRLVLTDSGGIQEETTYLGIPCLTLRDNTERPITVVEGTNRLCSISDIRGAIDACLDAQPLTPKPPDRWDGKTAVRVADSISRFLASKA